MASGAQTDPDQYRDDRMYVMRLTSSFTIDEDGVITASMKRGEEIIPGKPLLLITYRNTQKLPAVRTDEFQSLQEALNYIQRVEPTCPRISLGGASPNPTPTWAEHLQWLHSLGFRSVAEGNAPIPEWVLDEADPREVFHKKFG